MRYPAFLALFLAILLFGCAAQPLNEGIGKNGRAYRGADSPRLVIYEYSDFECPFCGKAVPTVEEAVRAYPLVRVEFRHSPLPMHPNAFGAAVASVCAEEQGKFWKMHDVLFANQDKLSASDLEKYAGEIGMDVPQYKACFASDAAADKVRLDMADAAQAGVDATPYFVIGNTVVKGAQPIEKFKLAIDTELARAS